MNNGMAYAEGYRAYQWGEPFNPWESEDWKDGYNDAMADDFWLEDDD